MIKKILSATFLMASLLAAQNSGGYAISTPRPINPAEGTTTPSASASQRQNPFLGSVPQKATGDRIDLTLKDAISRGLQFNLGLIESSQASAVVQAERLRALSELLPQVSAQGKQAYESISYKEIGLKLPPLPGLPSLPPTSGGFGYQDARVGFSHTLYSAELRNQYKARKSEERSALLTVRDSRDVVVFAVATAYLQVVSDAARMKTAEAQSRSAKELDTQTADRVKSEVSPEIDSLRSQVEQQSAEQRLVNATNQFEKDKLALGRIIGLAADQDFRVGNALTYRPAVISVDAALKEAIESRADLKSAEAEVRAGKLNLRSKNGERLPVISVSGDYGGAGANIGNFNRVYSIAGSVSVPIFTGGRIRADVEQAQADLARRQAEYEDLKGRVAYDVRTALLDVNASDSSVRIAQKNQALAQRAMEQAEDRYGNGVTNYLEVVQAQEIVALASDNYIQSLFSLNIALISLARATGGAETKLAQLLGGN